MLIALMMSMSCASTPCPRALERPEPAAPMAADPLRRAPFELGLTVMGRETRAPWIEITVGGVRTKAILDTGAELHVIQSWFAERAGVLENGSSPAQLSDSSGGGTEASFAEVDVVPGRWGRVRLQAVVVPSFSAFEEAGIGMVLNPQLLASGGRAVQLDFIQQQMQELSALPDTAGRVAGQSCTTVSRLGDGALITTHRYVVEVGVEGVPTTLQLDTGARTSVISEGAEVAESLAARPTEGETAFGLLGSQEVKVLVDPITFRVQDDSFAVAGVRIQPPEPRRSACNDEGLLGMDVLQHCVVALTLHDARIDCRVPDG